MEFSLPRSLKISRPRQIRGISLLALFSARAEESTRRIGIICSRERVFARARDALLTTRD